MEQKQRRTYGINKVDQREIIKTVKSISAMTDQIVASVKAEDRDMILAFMAAIRAKLDRVDCLLIPAAPPVIKPFDFTPAEKIKSDCFPL